MNKLLLKIDYFLNFDDEFVKHLLSLDGIKNASITKKSDNVYYGEVNIEYNSNIIDLKVLKLEILSYLKLMKLPSIEGFDKYIDNGKEYTIHIDDVCCEYCMRSMIEDLFDMNGMISASHNYDERSTDSSADVFITYDDSIIDDDKLKELNDNFNNYKG